MVVLSSDDFWSHISGVVDFRERLLHATQILASLMHERSSTEVERIRCEAIALYDDGAGRLKIDALANPPRRRRHYSGTQLTLPL